MKTLLRIVAIVAVFALAMELVYFAVGAGGASATNLAFEGNREQFTPGGERPDFDGGHREGGSMFGIFKSIVIVTLVTASIVIPRSLTQNRRKPVPIKTQ